LNWGWDDSATTGGRGGGPALDDTIPLRTLVNRLLNKDFPPAAKKK